MGRYSESIETLDRLILLDCCLVNFYAIHYEGHLIHSDGFSTDVRIEALLEDFSLLQVGHVLLNLIAEGAVELLHSIGPNLHDLVLPKAL